MQKNLSVFGFAFLVLLGVCAATADEAGPPSATSVSSWGPAPDVLAQIGMPEPHLASTCQATVDCKDGNVLQCSGTSCQADAYVGYVQCNNVRQDCPNRCEVFLYTCPCGPECWASCISTRGDCEEGPDYIRCDGTRITCNRICSFFCGRN